MLQLSWPMLLPGLQSEVFGLGAGIGSSTINFLSTIPVALKKLVKEKWIIFIIYVIRYPSHLQNRFKQGIAQWCFSLVLRKSMEDHIPISTDRKSRIIHKLKGFSLN